MDIPIAGHCRPELDAVRRAFAANFAERGEVGATVCVMVEGEVVVDLAGGWADEMRTRQWAPDTLVDVYSAGKAVVSTLALQLVDDGSLALDTPLADVWPEFAQHGKAGATLRHVLCHRAGVPAIRERLTDDDLWDWDRMAAAVAATEPWWEPGTRHAYHSNTFGHLVGEVIHRVTGELPGERLRAVAEPLGIDVWFGLPAEHHPLRPLRHRRRAGLRRPRCTGGVRLRHEPRRPALAELAQPGAGRRPLRLALIRAPPAPWRLVFAPSRHDEGDDGVRSGAAAHEWSVAR